MIEKDFDISFIAALALNEKQIQQNYRPLIGVHKWFARRPGTLFRGLLLSEFGQGKLQDLYYQANQLPDIIVADPFMGGGTPILEANRLGCNVIGADINPMAHWIVEREIAALDIDKYRQGADQLLAHLREQLAGYYETTCQICSNRHAPVKYFIWVKTQVCSACQQTYDLFPGYTLATNNRHPRYVLICRHCGELNEVDNPKEPGSCYQCHEKLITTGPARANRCLCPHCQTINRYPGTPDAPYPHRMIALEYHCPTCRPAHKGRFFKKPDAHDLARYQEAEARFRQLSPQFVPDDPIPMGDETDRLHRWGYRRYADLFNSRQLFGLELSCRWIATSAQGEVQHALSTNLSDLLRYQNMLCRYDASALKSLDIFSVHGFPVGLIQCESNLLGIIHESKGTNVGSGGWTNIIEKYAKAKAYCHQPFEIRHHKGKKTQVSIRGEWIGPSNSIKKSPENKKNAIDSGAVACTLWPEQQPVDGLSKTESAQIPARIIDLRCVSSTELRLPPESIDAVFTDPPYFANVQYAELMDFCYVWLRRLVPPGEPCFQQHSTRNDDELTGNNTMGRGIEHFTAGMSSVFQNMKTALKTGAPLAFTYHHNQIQAYLPIAVALLDAGFACTASLPCPAEMGASIHINNTSSSIVDTIFVCRTTGTVSRRTLVETPEAIGRLVLNDVAKLHAAGVKVSAGDTRCISYGHLIRLAIWHLRTCWDSAAAPSEKIARVNEAIEQLGGWPKVNAYLSTYVTVPPRQQWVALEDEGAYDSCNEDGGEDDAVSF
ncbi:DUF1156 domain-containing protein [Heliophilum fasciatum]|uniref:Adenine-specific DNA methylase n=1 Tax=Heliophilum fasciatum TaxID=35700 RepID=A0A4R2RRD1_9FIRM|nr:DNA methylase [Heliophilum fasciatum]MCW2277660.1 RNase P subunit RPR2 [Heliophilum fasciatum]TCP65007.1 hypothetical protein EDD73_10779 [Heliophilum fasciatum]